MADLDHQWGSDLVVGPTGDIATVSGSSLGQQRVLRRLLTNPLDYIWQPNYGAGLAQFVGQPIAGLQVQAAIRSQIFKEAAVAQNPEPTISVTPGPSSINNAIYVQVQYADADNGTVQLLTFSVGA